jgi:glycosyltransferase involved in cell wall biosynthesis
VLDQITIVTANYKTPALIKRLVEGLLGSYSQVRLLLIDNGSKDASTEYVRSLVDGKYNIKVILNQVNAGHGPAMHQGIGYCETPLVCLLDSDCIIQKAGGLELLAAPFSDPKVYATGELLRVDAGGNTRKKGAPYIHPSRLMIRRLTYWKLPPFNHHGAPVAANMFGAAKTGYRLVNIPEIDKYLHHPGRGLIKSGSHKRFGIPGWRLPAHYHPKDAPTAEQRLKGAEPVLLGKWS